MSTLPIASGSIANTGIDAKSCRLQAWSAPRPLLTPSGSTHRVARSPSVAAAHDELFVFGNDILFYDRPISVDESLTAWRVGLGPIAKPTGNFVFEGPWAILDKSDRIHLLWAEPLTHHETVPAYQWPLLPSERLWSAKFDLIQGWTKPSLLYTGPVLWKNARLGLQRQTVRNALVAIPREENGIVVAALVNEEWSTSIAAATSRVAYASALDLGSARLLAVVAADDSQSHDVNSVFLFRQEAGSAWKPWQQVQRSGEKAALEVSLIQGAGRRLHLVWRQMIRDDYLVVRHSESDDQGTTWSPPKDLLPGGVIQGVQAAVDTCGRLHVVYEDWGDGPGSVRIGHAVWDEGWSPPHRLHPDYAVTDVSLFARTNGSLALAFLGSRDPTNDPSSWMMLLSDLQ